MTLQRRTPLRSVTGLAQGARVAPVTDFATVLERKAARDARRRQAAVIHPAAAPARSEEDRFPARVRALILARPLNNGDGRPCELWAWDDEGCWGRVEAHHRKNTGAGGSTAEGMHVASNGIAACTRHHSKIHHSRATSGPLGLLLSKLARLVDPHAEPVSFDGGKSWYWLTDDGRYEWNAPGSSGGDAA